MKLSWRSLVTDDIGVDLGTSRTRVFARGRGIVVNEPSLLAYDKPTREVVAVGMEALELEGRASEDTQIVSPLQDGVVADSYLAGKLLESYIRKARDGRSHFSRRVLLAVQSDASDIEHYALQYAAREAGVNNISFINKGLAVTLGAGFDPEDQRASLVVDVGAGTTTVAGVIHNHVIFSRTIRVGGNDLDLAITNMIKYNHGLLVGPRTAERVKIELGCAVQLDAEQTTNVKGRSTVTGSPANPTTAFTTTSATSTRSARSATTSAKGSAAATSARRDASATATTCGRNSSACSIRTAIDEATPRATTW